MGKIILTDVEVSVDVREARDYKRKCNIEGDDLADLKATGQKLLEDLAEQFGTDIEHIQLKNARLSQKKFVFI